MQVQNELILWSLAVVFVVCSSAAETQVARGVVTVEPHRHKFKYDVGLCVFLARYI